MIYRVHIGTNTHSEDFFNMHVLTPTDCKDVGSGENLLSA